MTIYLFTHFLMILVCNSVQLIFYLSYIILQAASKRNQENREKQELSHCSGTKSFARLEAEMV